MVASVLLVTACGTRPVIQDEPPSWSMGFEHPIKFQLLVDEDLLVVATTRHLYGLDPVSGETLWRQRNVVVSSNDLISMGGDGYLLVNDAAGGAFDDRGTNILALDPKSGEIVWESRLLEGKILQGTLGNSQKTLFFTQVLNAHGDDRGFLSGALGRKGLGSGYEQQPYFGALDVSSGRLLWSQEYEKAVRMRPSQRRVLDENADWTYIRPFDLGLYHPPVHANGLLCLTYTGINCYNADTGKLAWRKKFSVIEDELAMTYANPVVDETSIITTGNHHVRAYDLATGKSLWKSRRFDIVPEILLGNDVVYGQLGGQFFHLDKEKWKWKGEFGVFALNKKNGKTLWKYDNADDAISNILVYGDEVWLADEKHLIALDRRNGKKRFKVRHHFEEPPVYVALNELSQVVLVGEGEAAAFDPDHEKFVWYKRHAPVGPGAWKRFSRGLLHASGNILKFGSFVLSKGIGLLPSLAVPVGSINFKVINTKKIVSRSIARGGRRMAYQSGFSGDWEGNQSLSGNYQYFVTQPKGSKNVTLAMLNLSTGKTERLIRMDADYPNLVIDEGNNKIYETFGQQLVALPLQTEPAHYATLSQQ